MMILDWSIKCENRSQIGSSASACVKLLLSHGADPRAEDEEGTTPLDLAKDEVVKAAIHKVSRHQDKAKDKEGG